MSVLNEIPGFAAFSKRWDDEKQPTCPFCGHRDYDGMADGGRIDFWEEVEWECPSCDKKFLTEASITWTSREPDDEEEESEAEDE
jgi:transposase-like protein